MSDATGTGRITAANGIRIIIPDTLPMTWDSTRTKVTTYDSATDNHKMDVMPAVSFAAKGRVLVVPVRADFVAGEKVSITDLFARTFDVSAKGSGNLGISLDGDNIPDITVDRQIYMRGDAISDSSAPASVSGAVATQSGSTVVLTWEDPFDLDVSSIEIFRALNQNVVTGTNPFDRVARGSGTWVDKETKIGDTVRYLLRATDGRNMSVYSPELVLTLTATGVVAGTNATGALVLPSATGSTATGTTTASGTTATGTTTGTTTATGTVTTTTPAPVALWRTLGYKNDVAFYRPALMQPVLDRLDALIDRATQSVGTPVLLVPVAEARHRLAGALVIWDKITADAYGEMKPAAKKRALNRAVMDVRIAIKNLNAAIANAVKSDPVR